MRAQNRSLARSSSQTVTEYAGELGHSLGAAWAGRRWVAVGAKSSRRVSRIQEAVGSPFAVLGASKLTGISRGSRRELGACLFEGRPLRFDFWFPHLGIAVDQNKRPDVELDLKRKWCEDNKVIYREPCQVESDEGIDTLREMAQQRREGLVEECPTTSLET